MLRGQPNQFSRDPALTFYKSAVSAETKTKGDYFGPGSGVRVGPKGSDRGDTRAKPFRMVRLAIHYRPIVGFDPRRLKGNILRSKGHHEPLITNRAYQRIQAHLNEHVRTPVKSSFAVMRAHRIPYRQMARIKLRRHLFPSHLS